MCNYANLDRDSREREEGQAARGGEHGSIKRMQAIGTVMYLVGRPALTMSS